MGRNSEESLVAEAAKAIGGEPEIVAAGVFTRQDMIKIGTTGGTIGGLALGAAGSGMGMYAAKRDYAESNGMTVELILAVTSDTIYVVNRDTHGRLPGLVTTFDRATCEITEKNLGPSKFFHLRDATTGYELKLGGTIISKPDRQVMELLRSHPVP